jgi:hypothetical protein
LKQGHTSDKWADVYQAIISKKTDLSEIEKKGISLAIKMAKTDPKILDGWNDDLLV